MPGLGFAGKNYFFLVRITEKTFYHQLAKTV